MPQLELNKITQWVLALLSVALIATLAAALYQGSRVRTLKLAAGSVSGDSYILCTALKQVVERHNSTVKVDVLETGGTVENLQMLESEKAELAAAQADVDPGPSARTIAILFDDTFQLLVNENSPIHNFLDLRGRRIALARSGGQFDSFLRVADHFHLNERDFGFVGATDAAADDAFASGQADALFRVRALGNPTIQRLVNTEKVRFLSIAQAEAMKIHHPAFELAFIPAGAYLGEPTVPPEAVPTVSVHRMLLARQGADAGAVRALTAALIERRQEIMQEIPIRDTAVRLLLAQTRRPDVLSGFGPGLHSGAAGYYDKDKPSFLKANADYIGLMLSAIVMIVSWLWQFRSWMMRQQKNAGDEYSGRVVQLMAASQKCEAPRELDEMRSELLAMLTSAVCDLDKDKLSEDSFQSFRAVLQIALEVIRERRELLVKPLQHAEV